MTDEIEKVGLPAIYAATAQMLTTQDQTIWQRASNFMLFNGVLTATLVAVIQFGLKTATSYWAIQFLVVVGMYYAIFYFITFVTSLRRRQAYILLMQKQEIALGVARFGLAAQTPIAMKSLPTNRLFKWVYRTFGPFSAGWLEAFTAGSFLAAYIVVGVWASMQAQIVLH